MINMEKPNEEVVFSHKYFEAIVDKSGYFTIKMVHNGVGIIALTKDNEIILINCNRKGIKKDVTEIPRGFMEKGDDYCSASKRELYEETGYVISENSNCIVAGTVHPNNGIIDTEFTFVIITNVIKETDTPPDMVSEHINNIQAISINELKSMCKNGEITDMHTIAALYYIDEFINH